MTLRAAGQQFTSRDAVRDSANCGCITENEPSDAELDSLIDQASDVLCMLSFGRVYGRQTVTVRPCRSGCWEACPCCSLDGVPLWDPKPVVSQVKIDGVALDPASYKIHETRAGYRLVKIATDIRPQAWPSWQDLWKPDTETNTFSITYTYGVYVDWLIEAAAIELTCSFASADQLKCSQLPQGVVSANYNNATVSLEERVARLRGGSDSSSVGPQMSQFMHLYAAPRSTAWSPELTEGWTFTVVGS